MTEPQTKKPKRAANAPPPGPVLADLAEIDRMVAIVRRNYAHAHDLAYSKGGGGGFEAIGRSSFDDTKPTEDAAINAGKDYSRQQVAHAARMVRSALTAINESHSALTNAMPGGSAYVPSWQAGDKDSIATRAEREASKQRQDERAKRGEL